MVWANAAMSRTGHESHANTRPPAGLVIVAAGSSTRMGGTTRKPWMLLDGKPVLLRTVEAFCGLTWIHETVVVLAPDEIAAMQSGTAAPELSANIAALRKAGVTSFAAGGTRRQDSVAAGLAALPASRELILIHDGARPFPSQAIIKAVAAAAWQHGAAIPVIPVTDTVKQTDPAGFITATPDRSTLRAVQTPQAFRRDILDRAMRANAANDVTDEAALCELAGFPVATVPGDPGNIKLTTQRDVALAAFLLSHAARETTN
jgi:2-C-methyl-D-erythritol 4-phosphate cytidylyltransferase